MKRKTKIIIVGAIAACVFIFILGFRSCKSLDYWKGQYSELKKITDANADIKDGIIKEQKDVIAAQDLKIADILAGAGQPTQAEKDKDKTIGALNAQLAKAKTDAERVPILEGLVVQWSDKFTISEQRRKDELFSINAEWQKKYDAQVVISDSWKSKYDGEHALRLSAEWLFKKAETKLKWSRTVTTFETVALVGLAGFAGYKLLKKGN